MRVVRFLGYLVGPLFAPLLLLPLLVAWVVLAVAVGLCETWQRAAR